MPFSSSMFPWLTSLVPNLQLGFLYNIGPNIRTGRFTADYLLPVNAGKGSILFGEAHFENQDFWRRPNAAAEYRIDISLGGGFRKLVNGNTFLGLNGFYDSTKVFGQWYSSGGLGLEMAAVLGGDSAVDLNFNYYGDIFNRDVLVNVFRNGRGSYDVEAGYSQSLFNQAFDLRLKAVGYQFDIGEKVYGWRTGGDLTTKNGTFTIRYEHGHDRIAGSYNTIGGFVNVGVQLDNLLKLESPFTAPEPVFKSPRNLERMLTQQVHRNWHLPNSVVFARSANSMSAAAQKPFFNFSISDPLANSIVRAKTLGETHTVIQITPGWDSCPAVFVASTQSLSVENYNSSAAINVRATVVTDTSVSGGCRILRVQLPTGLLLGPVGTSFPHTGTFVLPAGGSTWSFGPFAVLAYNRAPCNCGASITSGALAGTLVLEDLSGQIPTQTIDVITVP
ncbi:MAG: hypothetical protein HY913_23620 [Desulfomonile tiedjei]|nr:hypothetical protein [Desulfomonile tiedjei]